MAPPREQMIGFSEFKQRIGAGEIKRVEMNDDSYLGFTMTQQELAQKDAQKQVTVYKTVRVDDPEFIALMDSHKVEYYAVAKRNTPILNLLLQWVFPVVLLVVIWRFMSRRMGDMGSGVLSFGQNKAKIVAEGDIKVRFRDVAGVDEAKEELMEVVDFLKTPDYPGGL